MKILVLSYAISPSRGSEYSVAWNYVINMSKDNELVVLYGASGNHMGDTNELEQYMKVTSLPNVRFIAIRPNKIANSLNALNRKGILVYSFYLAYNIWHKQVYSKAKELISHEHFDLIHYLGPIGYREPGYLWKIDLPYIWGPIGGIPNRPRQLFKSLPFKDRVFFLLRNCINTIQFRYNRRLKKALQRTDLLLTATTENQTLIQNYYNKPSIYLPENGIVNSTIPDPVRQIDLKKNEIINILWIGRVDTNKSLNILLEALAKVKRTNWYLHVIGEGPKKIAMQKLSIQLKIDNSITWYGQVPRYDVFKILQIAHLHVVTSLGEANTTIIWEAMANSIPTITLNHCGMKDVICERCGVKINIESYEQVIKDLSAVIDDLLQNTDKIVKLSNGTKECLQNYTWDKRRVLFNQFYDIAISNWEQKKKNNEKTNCLLPSFK